MERPKSKSSPSVFLSVFRFLVIFFLLSIINLRVQGSEPKIPVRGQAGDLWSDIIIGKPDFSEVNPYSAGPNKLFLPHGVIVDRASNPNSLYIFDAGNNRILGLNLNRCLASISNPLNCSAGIVIGQPDMTTSACNGDSGFQNFPLRRGATASSLCLQPESQLSISEGGSGSSMALDKQGNLYITDFFNHRVLKYHQPMGKNNPHQKKDLHWKKNIIADEIWGQDNFSANNCNKGQPTPSASSLCFRWSENNWTAGVDVDANGNVWIADSGNNRVLRFPKNVKTGIVSKTADLVLGQSSFIDSNPGNSLSHLNSPAAVRVNTLGKVYVSDYGNNRIIVYANPKTGATGTPFGNDLVRPAGLDFDPLVPGIWITNMGHNTIELWNEKTNLKVREVGWRDNGNVLGDATGSIGIDSSGNLFAAIGVGDFDNDVLMFSPTATQEPTKQLFGAGPGNMVDAKGLGSPRGIVVSDGQLIVADNGRILFWNIPKGIKDLYNGKPADGVVKASNFFTRKPGCCWVMKADNAHHLWVTTELNGDNPPAIDVYTLPIATNASPLTTLRFPFNMLGGGQFTSPNPYFSFMGIAPTRDGKFLWISQPDTNRVFRIRDPLANPRVDIILGQPNSSDITCNNKALTATSQLCYPGSLSFDRFDNLYISDHSLEIRGNYRLLQFANTLFPTNNMSVIFGLPASKIFPNVATWEPAFDSKNRMAIGFNPYFTGNPEVNPLGGWFPGIYNNPFSSNLLPYDHLKDYYSMAFTAIFDAEDNLYIGDLDRSRVLIYKHPLSQ